jgi:hypothetical protein
MDYDPPPEKVETSLRANKHTVAALPPWPVSPATDSPTNIWLPMVYCDCATAKVFCPPPMKSRVPPSTAILAPAVMEFWNRFTLKSQEPCRQWRRRRRRRKMVTAVLG